MAAAPQPIHRPRTQSQVKHRLAAPMHHTLLVLSFHPLTICQFSSQRRRNWTTKPVCATASPTNSNSYGSSNRDMETPISALPSRFVENGLLPSPSSFYPEWGFGRDSNMLPSPLTFQTPVVTNGPSFARDDSADRKRKTSDGGAKPVRRG